MVTALGFLLFAAGMWVGAHFDQNGVAPTLGNRMLVSGLYFSGAAILGTQSGHEIYEFLKTFSGQ